MFSSMFVKPFVNSFSLVCKCDVQKNRAKLTHSTYSTHIAVCMEFIRNHYYLHLDAIETHLHIRVDNCFDIPFSSFFQLAFIAFLSLDIDSNSSMNIICFYFISFSLPNLYSTTKTTTLFY